MDIILLIGAMVGCLVVIGKFLFKFGEPSIEQEKLNSLLADERFKNAKTFNSVSTLNSANTLIAISEEGYIGIVQFLSEPVILHIKDINGFELVVDGRKEANFDGFIWNNSIWKGANNVTGTSSEVEKISRISLLFKVNDFNNPTLEVFLLTHEIEKKSGVYNMIKTEIDQLLSRLEIVEKKYKELPAPPEASSRPKRLSQNFAYMDSVAAGKDEAGKKI